MKGCARSLILGLALYGVIAGGIAWLLQQFFALPLARTWQVAIGTGLLLWAGLSLFAAIPGRFRERASIGACLRGERPVDGRQIGIVGTISALGPLLRAPLTGAECLAYQYTISKFVKSGKHSSITAMVEGLALTPSLIATPCGSFRLLAVPTLDVGGEPLAHEVAVRNAAELLRTGRFESPGPPARGTMARRLSDDDGAYRCEHIYATGPLPLDECTFRESVVRPGDKVYVHGLYSELRGGVVPHLNWATETRLLSGDVDEVARKLGRSIRNYAIGGVICCAIAAGILAAFLAQAGPA